MNIRPIAPDGLLKDLLDRSALPTSDIVSTDTLHFYGCEIDRELVAAVGLEIVGTHALLRSLAVREAERQKGLGRSLVMYAEHQALLMGIESVYLLTETASDFFERMGYADTSRKCAPKSISNTAQFSSLCPSNARLMCKSL